MDEDPGVPSSMRIIVVFGSAASVLIPAALWVAAIFSPKAAAIAPGASTFFATALGALLTAKVWQKSNE